MTVSNPQPAKFSDEPSAWREVARRFSEPGKWDGLCAESKTMIVSMSEGDYSAMQDRLWSHRRADAEYPDVYSVPMWTFARGDRDVRVLAALFLALEAEDESRGEP